ncbi:MAG: GIY-YIG nuclease family protein [Alphaproteobacteria bacterium]|nr:GIY-YIG nuclease family protein [Alphaproteobacteria bacterium]
MYYVYMVTNWNNTVLYTGITNDIFRRAWEHETKQHKGFTEKYNLAKMVYVEEYQNVLEAIEREKQIKRWRRSKKDALINHTNPYWNNLMHAQQDPSTSLGMTVPKL